MNGKHNGNTLELSSHQCKLSMLMMNLVTITSLIMTDVKMVVITVIIEVKL